MPREVRTRWLEQGKLGEARQNVRRKGCRLFQKSFQRRVRGAQGACIGADHAFAKNGRRRLPERAGPDFLRESRNSAGPVQVEHDNHPAAADR